MPATPKGNNSAIELVTGKKVVVAGPAAFALWPGQKAQVIDGHTLREDQYLVVRVYDTTEGEQGERLPIGLGAKRIGALLGAAGNGAGSEAPQGC